MTDQRKVQLGIGVDATDAKAGFDQVKAGARDMAQAVAAAGQQGAKGLDGIGAGGAEAASKLDKNTKSMIGSVQRATAAMQAGERGSAKYFETLAQQRGVSSDVLKPYIDQLKQAEAAQAAAQGSLGKMGISAAQTAAALRNVPAQFTDIITSIQGGQAPLTVLLQQGGQLKDMFGGAGAAAKALGGYILSLISPLTVAAAAVGVLGYAYLQGEKESKAYIAALTLTGNAAGTTVGQLQVMAAAVSAATGATKGAAAEALTALAANGNIGAEQLQRLAGIAIKIQRETGAAVSDTVKQFAELGKDPVAAASKLNDTTRFLTLSVYEQIKALEDRGQTIQAGILAQNAYADVMESRTGKLNENLGILEKSWRAVGSAAKWSWDKMLDIGRASTPETELAAAKKRIDEIQTILSDKGLTANWGGATRLQAELASLQAQVAPAQEVARLLARSADAEADRASIVQQRIKWDADGIEFLTKEENLKRNLLKAEGQAQDLLKAGAITREQYETRLADIRKKYTEKKTPSDDFGRIAADIGKELDLATQQLESGKKLNESDKFRVETLSKIDEALRKGNITKTQAIALEEAMTATQTKRVALEAQLAATKVAQMQYQDQLAVQEELNQAYVAESKAREQGRLAVDGYVKSIEEQNALTDLELRLMGATQQSREIALAQYRIELELKKQIDAIDRNAGFDEPQREEQRARARAAAAAASAAASNRVVIEAWKKTADQIEQSITDALYRGFESGKGFIENLRDTIVNTFKTMVLRPVISAIVNPVAGVLAGGFGVAGQAAAGQGASALGAAGNAGSAINGVSVLSSMKGWLTDFGGGVASQVSKLGNYLSGFSNSTAAEWGNSLMDNASAIGGYAQAAGTALGYINAAVAASKGQWGAAIGSAVGTYFGGPIGAAIGNALGGWVDSAFGGGSEYTTGTGISGKFSSAGFSGRSFQDWRNDGSSGFFGLGASGSSSGTNYSALDTTTAKGLSTAFLSVQAQTAGFADALGLSADTIMGFSKDVRVTLGSDAEANKKALQDLLTGIADDLAKTVLDTKYMREAETAASTLARLATNLSAVNSVFETMGKTVLATSQAGGDSASKLVELLGGLDQFNSTTLTYYQTFYTEAERNAKTAEQLSASFAQLGVAVPDSLQAYRDLVNAQDINTESGRKMYASLMGLSGAFATVTNAAADAASTLLKSMRFSTYVDYAAAVAGAGSTPAPRFASGGVHTGGLRVVGENGPELEATGPSRIWNDSQLRSALSGSDSTATADELSALRQDLRAVSRAQVSINARILSLFTDWDVNGMPEVRPA